MATHTSSYVPLATEQANGFDGSSSSQSGTDIGASGDSSANSINLSTGAMIAIIIVVVAVALIGGKESTVQIVSNCTTNIVSAATATLFFIAKKREWTMKETIRRSARKIKTVMTPRRSEFPSSVKKQMGESNSSRRTRPSPSRSSDEDLEKAWPLSAPKKKQQQQQNSSK